MDIRRRNEMKDAARRRLVDAPEEKKILLIYAGAALGLALLVTAVNYLLNLGIGKTGGLSNMGTRALLDTLSRVLPLVQSVIVLCLELGYMAAMLRIARGQYASHRTLKLGFDRFWPLLRLTLLRGGLMLGLGFASIYAGSMIYMMTPLANPLMEMLEPMLAVSQDPYALLESADYGALVRTMIPCFLFCGLIYALLAVPVWYRYRMAEYVLIDKPAVGAMAALRESRMMLRRNRRNLFRLDLSFWYYYLGLFLTGFVAYGDTLLALSGIRLAVPQEVTFFGFYVLYLGCQFALYWFLRNRMEVTYAIAYDGLRPKEPKTEGVVLGNIFRM